jgi:hypothetical protein
LIRKSVKIDYSLILHDYDKLIEVKYSPRRNDYNKDYHYRMFTNLDVKFDLSNRLVPKQLDINNNIFGYLAHNTFRKQIPEYDIIFYLHGGGFLSNTSEGHSDYLRK